MTWDEVMMHYDAAHAMARTYSIKSDDPEIVEDLTHDLLLDLLAVDVTRARGKVSEYIKGCLWKAASSRLFQGRAMTRRKLELSLEMLMDMSPEAQNSDSLRVRAVMGP